MKETEANRRARLRASLPDLTDEVDPPEYARLKRKEDHRLLKFSAYFAMFLALLVFVANFSIVRVDGHSMDPTLHNGQFFLAKKHDHLQRFQIIVLCERERDGGSEKLIVKRLIGFPGDNITVINGHLFVNGRQYDEYYLAGKNVANFGKLNWTITVPPDHVFVLGDNRDISKDSRIVGSFKMDAIVGVKI